MSITLILADDHPLTRAGLMAYLAKEQDFNVIAEYEDGESAMAGIRDLKPQVALLDIRMPGMDGVSITRKIKEEDLPVISLMLTSYDAQQYVLSSLRAGARGYVLKSSSGDILSRAIRIVARGGLYLDSEVASTVEEGENMSPEPISARERGAAAGGQGPVRQGDSESALHQRADGADSPSVNLRQARGSQQDRVHAARPEVRRGDAGGASRLS